MDEKKLKALAAELAKGLKTEANLNAFSRMLTKLTVETALNAGLTAPLGHEKNAPKADSNTRNGYSAKTLLCDDGEIELNTPRDRENTFEPQLIKKKSDTYYTDGQPDFIPVRQRHDYVGNCFYIQRDVRC
ncbi:conserved hypothetical protein [Serratia proteamaculans]|nr:conserved hypothetical protein [Serratia proteamaculans]